MSSFLRLLIMAICLLSCTSNSDEWRSKVQSPEPLHKAIKQITDVIVYDIFSPPVASRIYSYVSIAAYEAALPINPSFKSLAGQLSGLSEFPKPQADVEYCYQLAAVHAALKVGRTLIFSEEKLNSFYDIVMQDYRDTGMPESVYDRSIEFGDKVADHVIAWSSMDNYKQSRSFPKYTIQSDLATWKPTPPAYMDAIEPHWNKIRTLVIDSAQQFKPVPPTSFSTEKNSQFFKEAIEVYETVNNLSSEQREIALFWDCNPFMMNVKGHVMFATKKISPGGHWINITRVVCSKANSNFNEATEAYARVSIALFDGFISCWDEKYRSLVIRPETYINQYIDEDWVPLLQTPPFPEYTSGHSVISAASATTLTMLYGENFSFTDSTEVEFGLPVRTFSSFYAASDEAAISRMYGGIHYRPAIEVGIQEGKALGEFAFNKIQTRTNK